MPHQWSHGHFYWNELMTRNAERDKKFYGATVGWTFEAMPMPDGTYWVAKMGDQYVGAKYDASVHVRKAQTAGATLMRPIFDIPNVGRIAILKEPGGAGIGWMTPPKM